MNSLPVLDPDSPQARAIFHLGIVSSIIFAPHFPHRRRDDRLCAHAFPLAGGRGDPDQAAGNKTVEIVWTAIPCLIVVALVLLTGHRCAVPTPRAGDAGHRVTGHQWWWEARYPKSGVVVANEIHIPVGKSLSIGSRRPMCCMSFGCRNWRENSRPCRTSESPLDSVGPAGDVSRGSARSFAARSMPGCTFCVVAERRSNSGVGTGAAGAGGNSVERHPAQGFALFQENSCVNCHAINGTTASARVRSGPSHILRAGGNLGAGIAENTPDNLRRWLADPQQIKPGVKMPDYNFTRRTGHAIGRLLRNA